MRENKLVDLSIDFAVKIIELVKELKLSKETIISSQMGRSGTSIGQIYMRRNMRMARRILLQNYK